MSLEIKVPAELLDKFTEDAMATVLSTDINDLMPNYKLEIVAHKCDVYFLEQKYDNKVAELMEVIQKKGKNEASF